MRAVLIDSQSRVVNIIEIDENSDYEPDEGYHVVIPDPNDTVTIGDIFTGGTWTPDPETPPVTGPVTPPMTVEERLNEMQTVIDTLVSNLLEG